jgi:bacterioferritin (cytochrome b1)
MADKEQMNHAAVKEKLAQALRLQYRSVLQYTLTAGSIVGMEYQSFGDRLWLFAEQEIDDARRLVEKLVALEGEPPVRTPELRNAKSAKDALAWLIESESEVIERLQDVIPETGHEGASEALEHLLEHIIMRKQEQVDFLVRAIRG